MKKQEKKIDSIVYTNHTLYGRKENARHSFMTLTRFFLFYAALYFATAVSCAFLLDIGNADIGKSFLEAGIGVTAVFALSFLIIPVWIRLGYKKKLAAYGEINLYYDFYESSFVCRTVTKKSEKEERISYTDIVRITENGKAMLFKTRTAEFFMTKNENAPLLAGILKKNCPKYKGLRQGKSREEK